jgi:hypothetical protein
VESGDSGEEENLDKYETDFIDDGDPDHDDGCVFILFYSCVVSQNRPMPELLFHGRVHLRPL